MVVVRDRHTLDGRARGTLEGHETDGEDDQTERGAEHVAQRGAGGLRGQRRGERGKEQDHGEPPAHGDLPLDDLAVC